MPDTVNTLSGAATENDDLDFRPLAAAPRQQPTSRAAAGSSSDLDFRPTPPMNLETLHEKQPAPSGAAAGTISLTQSMQPPKNPMPPKSSGLEFLSARSKSGDEISSD